MFLPRTALFPPIEPYRQGMLAVDDIHTLYWEECGNPDGLPVLFLHGGPGGGVTPRHRCFFHPQHYRIVLFDQRGAGRSTPLGEYRNNTTQLLIDDIERLRVMLGIEQWLTFGGSWGSTLALAYGQAHPERCLGFILRGIFLCTQPEIDWFMHGIRWFFPEAHDEFIARIPETERADLLHAYEKRLFCDDPDVYMPAARAWSRYEGSCLFLRPEPEAIDDFGSDAVSLGIGRLEAHYFLHRGFFEEDQLVRGIDRIRHLPAVIIQGRYDVVCPPATAHRLHQAWPEAAFHIVPDAGHAAAEPGITSALVNATEQFRLGRGFI
ncbi:prolyl aminopeptidase Serine peptidase. MEROPS family S33 [Noviherbaspirillum humi]|uniref:Proline iminopeptidase n=1 Tax=Noviherbaspirillum humi TaxID=1688639 RepID=A0A239BXT1_9BURK|nr:prolyl aminopeptidase [Noviherbaspirillum humi]SNS12228.1 prolyl aminopeptidase Serine peptidase. MEROPS family S33 [Noviherbaspirillum humi]